MNDNIGCPIGYGDCSHCNYREDFGCTFDEDNDEHVVEAR